MKLMSITCLMLAVLFIVSCAADTETAGVSDSYADSNGNAAETTEADNTPPLPDTDLEDYVLRIGKPIQENIAWSTITFAVESIKETIITEMNETISNFK